jgi:hypothetical protein
MPERAKPFLVSREDDPQLQLLNEKIARLAFRLAIKSKRLCVLRLPSSTKSMFCSTPISGRETDTRSKPDSESNRARNPTTRSGSLSTKAIRMSGFVAIFLLCASLVDLPPVCATGHIVVWRRMVLTGHLRNWPLVSTV